MKRSNDDFVELFQLTGWVSARPRAIADRVAVDRGGVV